MAGAQASPLHSLSQALFSVLHLKYQAAGPPLKCQLREKQVFCVLFFVESLTPIGWTVHVP